MGKEQRILLDQGMRKKHGVLVNHGKKEIWLPEE